MSKNTFKTRGAFPLRSSIAQIIAKCLNTGRILSKNRIWLMLLLQLSVGWVYPYVSVGGRT